MKINKYHLKSLQDTYSKNTYEGATQKQSTSKQKNKIYKTVINLFRDSPHPDPTSCDNQSVEFRQNSNNWFLQNVRQQNKESQQTPVINVNKSELK